MKNILLISAGIFLFGLLPGQGYSQTITEVDDTGTNAVYPLSDQNVQPIPKPSRSETLAPTIPEPLYLNSGQNPPADVTRPIDPLPQPSIDRLYMNRIEVDTYSPEVPQNQTVAPPPSTMKPQQAPNRPGTLGGTGNQGNVGTR